MKTILVVITTLLFAFSALSADTIRGTANLQDEPDTVELPIPEVLVPPDGSPGDYFGYQVAVSGDWAAIASHSHLHDVVYGSVYVFRRTTTGWEFAQELVPSDVPLWSGFGSSVAIDGEHLMVSVTNPRSVFAYRRIDGQWQHTQTLSPTGLGAVSALSGTTLAVGTPGRIYGGRPTGGFVVYEFDGSQWQLAQEVQPPNDTYRYVGGAVDVSGNVLVATGSRAGSPVTHFVIIYSRADGTWHHDEEKLGLDPEQGFLSPTVTQDGVVAAGAPREAVPGGGLGVVYVWEPNGANWDLAARLYPQNVDWWDEFGDALDMVDGTLLVGSRLDDYWAEEAGSVYVYSRGDRWWSLEYIVDPPVPRSALHFGRAVAADSDTWLVGTQPGDIETGEAVAYQFDYTPPVISGTEVTPATGPPGTMFEITSTITDDSGVGLAIATIRDSGGLVVVSLVMSDMGSDLFDAEWDSSIAQPGEFTVDITATDLSPSQNQQTVTAAVTLEITVPDTAPPEITGTSVTPSAGLPGTQFQIQATVTDASGVESVEATIRDSAQTIVGSLPMTSGGMDVFTAVWDSSSAEPDVYTVDVTAVDSSPAHNQQTSAFAATFEILVPDTSPPEISGVLVIPSAGLPGTQFQIQATVTDGSGVESVQATIRDSMSSVVAILAMGSAGPDVYVAVWDSSSAQPGMFTVDITAVDQSPSHNQQTVQGAAAFEVLQPDTIPPEITNVTVTPDVGYAGTYFHIEATVTDASGVASVEATLRLVGGGVIQQLAMAPIGSNVFGADFDSTGAPTGIYTVEITATDASQSANQSTVVDAAAFEILDGLFEDGFESGDTTAWSATVP